MKVIINHSSNLSELQSQFCFSNCIYIIGIDGMHDDTKALQQTINIANTCGSIVRLPQEDTS